MVIIMRGVPGSGKTTYREKYFPEARVFSADNWFQAKDGSYKFDPSQLPAAHASCLRDFIRAIQNEESQTTIVVDNTNIMVSEIAPYAAVALAYKYTLRIVTLRCDSAVAYSRCTHGVSQKTITKMARLLDLEELHFPGWWDHLRV